MQQMTFKEYVSKLVEEEFFSPLEKYNIESGNHVWLSENLDNAAEHIGSTALSSDHYERERVVTVD